jgi:Uncharacterised protein family (UPF0158)
MDDTSPRDPQPASPRRLKIDLADLAQAFDNAGWETTYFLDLDTGRVIMLTEDARGEYKRLSESVGHVDKAEWAAAFEAALQEADLPDWQVESIRDASQVDAGFPEHYLRVPEADSREGYRDMEAFIETVINQRLADRLGRAIQGRGAFRAFKDVLLDQAGERERWFAFRDARQRARVLEWLADEEIELERDTDE